MREEHNNRTMETKTIINFGITLKIYLHAFRRICIIIRIHFCAEHTDRINKNETKYLRQKHVFFYTERIFRNFNNDVK